MKALLSVYDKSGVVELARSLHDLGWQLLSSGVHQVGGVCVGFTGALEVVFQADELTGVRCQVRQVHPHPAAVLEHASRQARTGGLQDQAQAAFLSRPPDVGGFPAQGGFIKVALIHGGNYILHLL